jgi:hypothetical protein
MHWSLGNGWSADTGSEHGLSVVRVKRRSKVVAVIFDPERQLRTDDLCEYVGQLRESMDASG